MGRTVEAHYDARFDADIGAWILSSYADVSAALRDSRFVVSGGSTRDVRASVRGAARDKFPAERMAEWQQRLETSAREMVDALPRRTTVDLIESFAEPWALSIAMRVAGASSGNRERLASLSRELFLAAAFATNGEASSSAAVELAIILGGRGAIDVQSFVALSQTVPAFLGAAWLALFSLDEKPRDVTNSIDELLRFAGPSRAVFRVAASDVGPIRAGQRVALMLARANRDPAKFPDPDRLDFSRDALGHLAFGLGAHSCVGASMVRMCVIVATNALLQADLAVVEAQWIDGFAIRAPSSLIVELH